MEWISNVLVLEKLVLIENARLKTAQTMVIKYMYNGHLYMYKFFFFLSTEQYVLFDIFQYISIKDMCGIIVVYISLEFAVYIQ